MAMLDMAGSDDEDDDLEWEEWLKLTENQQEAMIAAEMKKLIERRNRTPTPILIRMDIERNLDLAVKQRSNWRRFKMDLFREHLKKTQVRLLKLRSWRQTGVYPGEA